MSDILLRTSQLSFAYPQRASSPFRRRTMREVVKRVDLAVPRGSVLGLVGESGSGKTTLGRLLVRLLRPSSGGIQFDGVEIGSLSEERLRPLLEQVESLTAQIKKLDSSIEQIARTSYPETELLRQVSGVGILIALTFVLTVEDRERFQKSRDVGCYVGLRPKQSEWGQSQPQLSITKEGDRYLRTLLVQGAHLILNRRGPDTDLKRWGLKLASHGGKNAKKRAVVAVARDHPPTAVASARPAPPSVPEKAGRCHSAWGSSALRPSQEMPAAPLPGRCARRDNYPDYRRRWATMRSPASNARQS